MGKDEKQDEKEEKKIIIDDDWKQQAQKEKENLAAQEKAGSKKEEAKAGREKLPRGDFAAIISMLTTQAFFAMGLLRLEGQEDREPDLEMARYNIDMLQTLEEKTKGNLSEPEQKVLTDTLSQLRMAFVKMSE